MGGEKEHLLLERSQVSSAHLSHKISMKIKTIYGAKERADSTDTKFYLLLNVEMRNLEKKKQFGCFTAVGLIDLSGGSALQARSSNFELENRLSILNLGVSQYAAKSLKNEQRILV